MFCSTISAATSKLDTFHFGPERPKIGVVLSGGGAKGMAHVGTLKMLETLNIPVDYIGGTSMGAVVGGLYAMGYTADQIDTIIRTTDWMSLFNDFPRREYIGVHEKKNNDPYQLRLSLAPNDIALFAKGAIDGQHIDNMLNHYLFEAYKTPNFSDLKIPFFCIGTDIITAQYVVLDSGNLAQAIRASMAVPTVFSPVEIDGRLLVDGGVINNFPVLEMRQRGVDIIIGVDVGFQYKCKSELQNLANILEQVIFLAGQDIQQKNVDNCDIFIAPDLGKFAAFSFMRYDSILERGYQAAQAAYPELSKLATLLSEKYGHQAAPKELYQPKTMIILDTIVLEGNHEYSDQYVLQRLQLKTNTPIPLKDVEEAIHRLFGSMSFTKVTYYFDISPYGSEHTTLHVVLLEAPLNMVKLGFRYDNIRGPSLLAGLTMRNLLLSNSEFTVNLDVSMLPIVDVQYRFSPVMGRSTKKRYSIWKPTLFASYMFCNLKIYDYNVATDSAKIFRDTEYGVIGNRFAIGTEFNVKSNTLGLGLYLDHTVSNERVGGTGTGQRLSALYLYPQFYYLRNSFNKRHYPTKGTITNVRVRLLHALDRNTPHTTWVRTSATYYLDAQYAIPFSKHLTLYPSAMIAGTLVFQDKDMSSGHISQQQQFYQGGLFHIPHVNQTPFVGLYFMQKVGLYGANVQLNTQYEVFKNFFLTARIGALKSESDYSKMFDLRNTTFGAGISASINTTIGPIGMTVHGSNHSPVGVFINLGFWL
ncbi:MAG: patatin-like phospholipase family protein [Bacteroidales bacterium]|nr:patatin-like phospholipase family protein [Bacteroidales bacterium]